MKKDEIKEIADQLRTSGHASLPVKKISTIDLVTIYNYINTNPHYFVKLHRSFLVKPLGYEFVQHILDEKRDDTYGRTKCGCLVEIWEDQISPKIDHTRKLCKVCKSVVVNEAGGVREMDTDQYDMFDEDTPLAKNSLDLSQNLMNFRDVLRNWKEEGTIEKAVGAAVVIQVLIYALQLGDDTFDDVVSGVAKISNEIAEEVEKFNRLVIESKEVTDS